ncbi:MAG: F0F1 ATP synthase subunit delta [Coriobacteriales bacterium]|nr:F0F1 ATP synthase subunit delta [Coriobacteriales bacterium]
MRIRAVDKQKIEEYARSLLDAAKGEGRAPLDVQQLRHAVKFSPEVLSVLARMESESDSALITQVYEDLKTMLDSEDETVTVDVTTAVPMNAELRRKVRDKCAADFDAPIFLVEHVEPKILGGIIIEAKGHRRDASIRAQLVNIRKTLSSSFMGGDA